MKKTVLFVFAAVVPALMSARTPIGAMSADEIKASDRERWGERISMSGAVADEFAEMEDRLKKLTAHLQAFCNEKGATKPDRTDLLLGLSNALMQPLVPPSASRGGKIPTSGDDEATQRGYERLNAFKSMCLSLDRKSRPKLRLLVMDVIASRQVERRSKWAKAQAFLEFVKYTEKFREMDKSYEEFMGHVDGFQVRRERVEVLGTEMLMATRLDRYADSNCRKKAWLDSDLRVVDRYLLTMKQDELDEFEKNTASIKKESMSALGSASEDFDFYDANGLGIEPSDRKTFEAYFSQLAAFVDQVDKVLVAESEQMIAKAKDKSTEIGMLRSNTGFSPYKAFLASGPTQNNGCPGYSRRVRVLMEDCKKRYLNALKATNEYWKSRGRDPIVTEWK